MVNLWIKHGANMEIQNEDFHRPFHISAKKNYQEITQILLQNGENVNAKCQRHSALEYAAVFCKFPNIVEMLIAHGAEINNYHFTPLHAATISGKYKIFNILMANGANVNVKTYQSMTPLHGAIKSYQIGNQQEEIIEKLISRGAEIDSKTDDGLTALHFCIEGDKVGFAKILLQNGASMKIKTRIGKSPLEFAMELNHNIFMKLLIHSDY